MYGPTLRLGASEVIPHGAEKGNLRFTGSGPTQYGVLDLAGQSETINGLEDNAAGAAIIDNLAGGNSTLSIGAGDTTSAFLGTIQNTAGTVAVTKIGSGTLTLSGPNTYSGDTTISAGTLALGAGGSLANSAAISVASGATFDVSALTGGLAIAASQSLGGTGSILGSLAFGADSKLAFGSSLTVNSGTVTFNGFGINDIIGLDGSLVSAGTYTLLGGDATFDLTNALDVGAGNAVDIGGGKTAYLQEGSLQVVVVPEPAGLVVAGLGIGLAVVAAARRRRW